MAFPCTNQPSVPKRTAYRVLRGSRASAQLNAPLPMETSHDVRSSDAIMAKIDSMCSLLMMPANQKSQAFGMLSNSSIEAKQEYLDTLRAYFSRQPTDVKIRNIVHDLLKDTPNNASIEGRIELRLSHASSKDRDCFLRDVWSLHAEPTSDLPLALVKILPRVVVSDETIVQWAAQLQTSPRDLLDYLEQGEAHFPSFFLHIKRTFEMSEKTDEAAIPTLLRDLFHCVGQHEFENGLEKMSTVPKDTDNVSYACEDVMTFPTNADARAFSGLNATITGTQLSIKPLGPSGPTINVDLKDLLHVSHSMSRVHHVSSVPSRRPTRFPGSRGFKGVHRKGRKWGWSGCGADESADTPTLAAVAHLQAERSLESSAASAKNEQVHTAAPGPSRVQDMDDDDEVEFTGEMTWSQRDAQLRSKAVCLD